MRHARDALLARPLAGTPMTADGVWAVFSTYRPVEGALAAVESVADQVEGVIVVDDGSGPGAAAILAEFETRGIIVERMAANHGIAAALNHGIARARREGAEYVVTFDQDSHVAGGFVDALLTAHTAAVTSGVRVGVVVPEYFAGVRQQRGGGRTYGDAVNVIQSGMLIPLRVVSAVGPLRADFFIDLVDTEFELRLRREGYGVIAATGLRMDHALGTKYRRELFGRPVRLPGVPPEITLSTPFRYFYRVRNRIVLDRDYLFVAPRQLLRDSALDGIHFVNALWVARPRRALLRLYRAAVFAALRGRMGGMPAALTSVASSVEWDAPVLALENR